MPISGGYLDLCNNYIYKKFLSKAYYTHKKQNIISLFKLCWYIRHFQNDCSKQKIKALIWSIAVSFGHETLRRKNSRMSRGWQQLQYPQVKPAVNHCICKANAIVKRNYFRGIILPLWVQNLIHAKTNQRIPELDTGVIKCSLTQHKL